MTTKQRRIEDLEGELESLESDIKQAHEILTRLGAGKEHWGVPGRIHSLLLVLRKKTPEEFDEILRKEEIIK